MKYQQLNICLGVYKQTQQYYNNKLQRTSTYFFIMATITCTIYTLFIISIIALCLGITQLVLQIVFKFIGFTSFTYSLDSGCATSYLTTKSTSISNMISTAFVGTCLGLLSNIIIFIAILLSFVSLRKLTTEIQTSQNKITQNRIQQLVEDIHPEKKYQLLYVPLAFGLLGQLVTFGYYLAFFLQPKTQSCTYTYNATDVLVLMVISGVWYVLMLVFWVLYVKMSERYLQQIIENNNRNKYMEMQNVTNMTTQLHQNPRQIERQRKQNLLLKSSQKKNTQNIFESNYLNPNSYQKPSNSSNIKQQNNVVDDQQSFKRGIQSSNIKNQQRVFRNTQGEENQRRRPRIFNESSTPSRQNPMFQRSNNSRSPNESPIKEGDIHLKYNDSYNNSPNKFDRYDREDRRNQENKLGQLVYRRKFGGQSAQKNQNELKKGFQTPTTSKFGSKFFKEQQNKYLNQNVKRSILPSQGMKERDPTDSRKVVMGQSYYRNYQKSKYEQSPPESRFKNSRQGVLTNYIRGKYA